jgi:hypothetical protein
MINTLKITGSANSFERYAKRPIWEGALELEDDRYDWYNIVRFPAKVRTLHVTFFRDEYAKTLKTREMPLEELRELVATTNAKKKESLPWLKCATFGDKRTTKGSLRHDANVESIDGIELDYDGKKMPFEEGVKILKRLKLSALIYTSPSYTKDEPKWRVVLPTSQTLPPGERVKLATWVNDQFGGIFSRESLVLSQSYYFGSVHNNPAHRAVVVKGEYVDLAAAKTKVAAVDVWERFAKGQEFKQPIDIDQLLEDMVHHGVGAGGNLHFTQLSVTAAWLNRGISVDEAVKRMLEETHRVADHMRYDSAWWKEEEKRIRKMCTDWVKNHPECAIIDTSPSDELFDPWARFVVPDFPLDVLPPVAQEFVVSQSEVIGVDRASMGMCVLNAFSGALNHSITLKMMRHGTWHVSPRLWVLLYGDASTKKTPSINAATEPLEDYQKALQQEYKQAMIDYEVACALEKGDIKPVKPELPIRYVVYDSTIEKLGEMLARSERGLLVKRDEFAGWIGSMEQYSKGMAANRAFWLKAHDGGPFVVDRIGRGEIFIANLSVSLIGGIQPEKMGEMQGLTSDGLLQRFIPVMMGPAQLPIDRPSDIYAYARLVRTLIDTYEHVYMLSDPALEVMSGLHKHLHDLACNAGGMARGFQSFLIKLQGMAGSLALILHMVAEKKKSGAVELATVKKVHRLVIDFILPHAFEFYRTTESATTGDRLKKIASWILTNGKERFVVSDLTSNVADLRGLTLFDVNERVSPLVAVGWLKAEERNNLNRAWRVNPKVFTQFAERLKEEEKRKAQLAELMNSPRRKKG